MPDMSSPTAFAPNQSTRLAIAVPLIATVAFLLFVPLAQKVRSPSLHRSVLPPPRGVAAAPSRPSPTRAPPSSTRAAAEAAACRGPLSDASDTVATAGATLRPSLTGAPSEAPPSLREYIHWHANATRCLRDASCVDKPRTLVWSAALLHQPCAGLGDRFRGIAVAFTLAVASRRAFYVHWPQSPYDHFPLSAALRPAAIDWLPPPGVIAHLVANKSMHADDERRSVVMDWGRQVLPNPPMPNGMPRFNFSRDAFDTPGMKRIANVAIMMTAGYGYLDQLTANVNATARVPDIRPSVTPSDPWVRALLKSLFAPRDAVRRLAARSAFAPGKKYVSVHARTGDDVGEAGDRFATTTEEGGANLRVAQSLLSCAAGAHPSGETRVFLATDSTPFKAVFAAEARKRSVKVKYTRERALHLHVRDSVVDKVPVEQRCRQYLNVFVDLLLLSQGEAIITTGSGFSRTALNLGNATSYWRGYHRDIRKANCSVIRVR